MFGFSCSSYLRLVSSSTFWAPLAFFSQATGRTSEHVCGTLRGFALHSAAGLSHREGYSQFLREMIIQPGISKAKSGCSREDVTMEDHVSPIVLILKDSIRLFV